MMTPVMMLQLVPTIPTDPAAAPDPATVVSGIMDQVILAAAPQVHAAGLDLWRGLAAILIVWTGLRIAFTGDFRPWDLASESSSLSGFRGQCSPSITIRFPDRPALLQRPSLTVGSGFNSS